MSDKEEWGQAALDIANTVVKWIPDMNRELIRRRVYEFFVREAGPLPSYGDVSFYFSDDITSILVDSFPGDAAEDEDAICATSDINWAFGQLSDDYKYRIIERFKYGVLRPHDSPERAQLNRAVQKLADILNTWNRTAGYEGPGSRRVISNATARYVMDNSDD